MLDSGPLLIASPLFTDEACFSVPAVRSLHFAEPNRPLIILCSEELIPIWKTVTGVTKIISHSDSASPRKITKLLGDYTQALIWDDHPAAAAVTKKGIAKRIGPSLDTLNKFLTNAIDLRSDAGPIEHRVRHYLKIAENLGAQPFKAVNFQTTTQPSPPSQLRIGVAPGSDFGPASEWPLARFRELLGNLSADFLIFSSRNRPTSAKNLSDFGRIIEPENALAELASCHLLIGNDGSLPHLAAHVGTPTVVIFGPNEPLWKRPLGTIHRVVHERVACSSCLLAKCQLDHRCMSAIPVSRVLSEVTDLLS